MNGRRPRQRYEPLMVLAYIATYQQIHQGQSPSERRIQKDLGMSSSSVAHNVLQRLKRAEFLVITTYGREVRADLAVTAAGQRAAQTWQEGRTTTE